METVNFQCGHCRQLLAVSKQHLGQQVRCPHCQQVVVAPPPESVAPPPPAPAPALPQDPFGAAFSFAQPKPEEHDSIFSAPAESDDLFGPAPSGKVEMPPDFRPAASPLPPWLSPVPPPAQVPDLELAPSPPVPGPEDATLTFVPGHAPAAAAPPTLESTQPTAPATELAPAPFPGMGEPENEGDLASAFTPARPRVSRGWHIALFIIPLISYAVLVTLVAFIFWRRLEQAQSRPHPLEMVPDIDGDHPTRRKDWRSEVRPPRASTELPAKLKVSLGQTLRLGELEVTPEAVKRGYIEIKEEGKTKTEKPERKALKLYLKLKNVSKDLAFYPLDNYFMRQWRVTGMSGQSLRTQYEPYTQLVIAGHHFYGGPAGFNFKGTGEPREYVVGTDYDRLLKPGEEMTTFICSDPEDKEIDQQLAKHKGETLLWRVQVRRGSVEVKGRRVPVCAVFGVEFTDKDITNSK